MSEESLFSSEKTDPGLNEPQTTPAAPPPSRAKKTLGILGWSALGLFFLVLFTLMKLPEPKVRSYLLGKINQALSKNQMSLTARNSDLSVGLGIQFELTGVTLSLPPPAKPVQLGRLRISSALHSIFMGKTGMNFQIQENEKSDQTGTLVGRFRTSILKPMKSMDVDFDVRHLNLGETGLLPILTKFQGTAIIHGKGALSGEFSIPKSWNGKMNFKLSKIILDSQSIQGFSVPRVAVSDGQFDLDIPGDGKASLKQFRLGKMNAPDDDLFATLTGDLILGTSVPSTQMNIKAQFGLSEKLMKSFGLIDAILRAGKQSDGSYAYRLTGPIVSPTPLPIPSGG